MTGRAFGSGPSMLGRNAATAGCITPWWPRRRARHGRISSPDVNGRGKPRRNVSAGDVRPKPNVTLNVTTNVTRTVAFTEGQGQGQWRERTVSPALSRRA